MDRIKYIDVMKGGAILFVIYYHIVWKCISFENSYTVGTFNICCMQLFFLLSGYFSAKMYSANFSSMKKFLVSKLKTLLIPSITWFVIGCWLLQKNFQFELDYEFKGGFWFTYVLFFICVLHVLLLFVTRWISQDLYRFLLIFFIAIAFFILRSKPYWWFGDTLHYFSLVFVLKYYVFFAIGSMHIFLKRFKAFFYSKEITFLAMVIAILFSFHKFYFLEEFLSGNTLLCTLTEFLYSACFLLMIYRFFSESEFLSQNSIIVKYLVLLGRNSLAIYFIHYFFLFRYPNVILNLVNEMDKTNLFGCTQSMIIAEFVLVAPIAILISIACIVVKSIMIKSSIVAMLFFGEYPKK